MKAKTLKTNLGGLLSVSGFLLVASDASTPGLLLASCLFGFGLMFLGGAMILKANR